MLENTSRSVGNLHPRCLKSASFRGLRPWPPTRASLWTHWGPEGGPKPPASLGVHIIITLGTPLTSSFALGKERTLVACKSWRSASRFTTFTLDQCPFISQCKRKLDVFVKHGCTRWQQCQNMAKISASYILTLPHPRGM